VVVLQDLLENVIRVQNELGQTERRIVNKRKDVTVTFSRGNKNAMWVMSAKLQHGKGRFMDESGIAVSVSQQHGIAKNGNVTSG